MANLVPIANLKGPAAVLDVLRTGEAEREDG